MARPPVVGITGPARSGKDTLTNFIIARHGGYRYGFADPLKAMLHAGFGIDFNDPYWVKNKETVIPVLGKSPRQMMQTLGTEWGRDLVHPNVWVALALDRLDTRGPGMIVNDMRFDNEAKWLRAAGGLVIHISRKAAQVVNAHSSEAGVTLADGDLVFANDGGLEDIQRFVEEKLGGLETWSTFIRSVHAQFSEVHRPYYEKNWNAYRAGTPDVFYSGAVGAMWIEYKYMPHLPKKVDVRADLTARQRKWLNDRYGEGRHVAVVIGTRAGALLLEYQDWNAAMTPEKAALRLMSRHQLAQWIYRQVGPSVDFL